MNATSDFFKIGGVQILDNIKLVSLSNGNKTFNEA